MLCLWRRPDGKPAWRSTMENSERMTNMLMQANVDGHPSIRATMMQNITGKDGGAEHDT